MNKRKIYRFASLGLAVFAILMLVLSNKENENFSEVVKVSLRDVGNKLLLNNQDSTSLILPILKLEETKYQLSFVNKLAINPDSLRFIMQQSFQKAALPASYLVEVKQCTENEVAYSFQKSATDEKSILPCSGRIAPTNCYKIEVTFTNYQPKSKSPLIWYVLLLISLIAAVLLFLKSKAVPPTTSTAEKGISLGAFQFFPEENKLIREAKEINLSKKEAELLTVFIANPNKIIKREELSKKVWEDHGVFVGRSLDTYISKLRKKLKDDEAIKLTNVHGIGYMLEINN